MKKLLRFLQSNQAVLLACIMSLTTQLWHSVKAFVMLDVGGSDNMWNYLFGIMFSISTSFAILLFTVRGRQYWAYFFLVVEVFINVIHYNVMSMNTGSLLIATVFMCIIVPVTISIYSAEIDVNQEAKEIKEEKEAAEKKEFDFIEEINELIGFDITDPKDKSGSLSVGSKNKLRELWRKREAMTPIEIKYQMKSILKEGNPLFTNL